MTRALPLFAALLIAGPAAAANYVGKPVAPTSEGKLVARDIVWNLAGGAYKGSTSESRPLVLCQSLAKKAGKLESFTVDGQAFAEADLAKCNAVAPGGSSGAVAQAN